MSGKRIKVSIDAIGNPKVEAIGFNGVGCEAATASIEAALNSSPSADREFKPEWSAPVNEEEQDHNKVTW